MPPNGHEGGVEAGEWARWRGGLEARVGSLEKTMDTLIEKVAIIDRTGTRTEGRVETLQRDVGDMRVDIAEAAGKIDRGREDAVKTLQDTIKGRDMDAMSWRITKWQVVAGAIVTLLVGTASSLIVLAIAGKLT